MRGLALLRSAVVRRRAIHRGRRRDRAGQKTQNPVGDLVSLPFQFNFNSGGGYDDQTFFNLNFQPVVPIKISRKTTLIARAIVPFVDLPGPTPFDRTGGTADIQTQFFFTPAAPGKLIWVSAPRSRSRQPPTTLWPRVPGPQGRAPWASR